MEMGESAKGDTEFEHVWDDAYVMADTLRQIESVCRNIAACSEDPSNIDEICRILFSCTVPYGSDYLNLTGKKAACDRAKAVLEKYGQEVGEYEERLRKAGRKSGMVR